ncbi:MAG: hypothetical protein AAGB04_27770 [Pseudomonadota bacterium]
MLIVISATLLLFAVCAMFYQADERRSAIALFRTSRRTRTAIRTVAGLLALLTLVMIASLRGWELGIPIWLGIFSLVFVVGLFLSAQKPNWHPKILVAACTLGALTGLASVAL